MVCSNFCFRSKTSLFYKTERFEDSWLSLPHSSLLLSIIFSKLTFHCFCSYALLIVFLFISPWVTLFPKPLWDHTLGDFLPVSWTVPVYFLCEFLFCRSLKCWCFWVSVGLISSHWAVTFCPLPCIHKPMTVISMSPTQIFPPPPYLYFCLPVDHFHMDILQSPQYI